MKVQTPPSGDYLLRLNIDDGRGPLTGLEREHPGSLTASRWIALNSYSAPLPQNIGINDQLSDCFEQRREGIDSVKHIQSGMYGF